MTQCFRAYRVRASPFLSYPRKAPRQLLFSMITRKSVEKNTRESVVAKQNSLDSQSGYLEDSIEKRQALSRSSSYVDEPPNGGVRAWLQVLGGFFCNFNSWGIVNTFGVFQEYYNGNLLAGNSPGKISWIGSVAGALAFASTTFFGALLDAGYHSYLVTAAGITQAFGLMMLSLSKEYYQVMLTQGVLVGVSSGTLFLVSVGSVAPYFTTKRAVAIGMTAAGSSIGGVVYSSCARNLLPIVGFGWTVRTLGFLVLGTTTISSLCIRRRLPPSKRGGLMAVECFKEPVFLLYSISSTCGFCGLYVFFFYYQSYSLGLFPDVKVLLYITAILNAGSVVGRLLPNLLSNYMGLFNVLLLTDVLSMIFAFCWMAAKTEGGIVVVGLLFGIASGPRMGLTGAVVADLTSNLNRIGMRLSFVLLFQSVGVLVGAPFAGMLIRQYGWFYAKLYSALAWLLACVFLFWARQILAKGCLLAKV